jgi:Fungal Zn(2)-Cys(6) binuclear cluster domain
MTAHHRTNSLAFAKSDCHSCSEQKRWCDRQRPQCGTCIKHRQKCGGYVLDLTWKQPSGNQTASSARSSVTPSPGCAADSERKFKFKQGRPKKRRKVQKSTDKRRSAEGGVSGSSLVHDEVTIGLLRPRNGQEIVEESVELLPSRDQDTESTSESWFQAEGRISEGEVDEKLSCIQWLTMRHQFEALIQLFRSRIGLPHHSGCQMMRAFGRIHWKQRGALLNHRLGYCSPIARSTSATPSCLTSIMAQTPQARPTVRTREVSLLLSAYLRLVTQIRASGCSKVRGIIYLTESCTMIRIINSVLSFLYVS